MSPTRQTQKTCPWGHVFHVRHVPTSQTPERALVGTFWCSLFPSLISNTRKCPCGHFLVLTHLSSPLPVLNTRTCPHGHVLVLAHLPSPSPSSQTPERACVWLVLVLAHLCSSFLSSRASERAHTGSF